MLNYFYLFELICKADLFKGERREVAVAVEAAEEELGEEGGAGQGRQPDLGGRVGKKSDILNEKPGCRTGEKRRTDLLLRVDEGDEDHGLHRGKAAHNLGRKISKKKSMIFFNFRYTKNKKIKLPV